MSSRFLALAMPLLALPLLGHGGCVPPQALIAAGPCLANHSREEIMREGYRCEKFVLELERPVPAGATISGRAEYWLSSSTSHYEFSCAVPGEGAQACNDDVNRAVMLEAQDGAILAYFPDLPLEVEVTIEAGGTVLLDEVFHPEFVIGEPVGGGCDRACNLASARRQLPAP